MEVLLTHWSLEEIVSPGRLTIHSAILSEMSKHDKDDWLRDLDARQRNVIFPDPAQNEGRFWRNLWAGKDSLNLAQWVGLIVLFLFFGGSLFFILRMLWPEGQGFWWQKAIAAYGLYLVVIGALVAFILIGNRRARRSIQKH